jgi:hypothetical protein
MPRWIRACMLSTSTARRLASAACTCSAATEQLVVAITIMQPSGWQSWVSSSAASSSRRCTPRRAVGSSASARAEATGAFAVGLDRFEEQVRLVAERGVETGRRDAHRSGQVGDRRGLVAVLPEHVHGLVERRLAIERERPPARLGRHRRERPRAVSAAGRGGPTCLRLSFHSDR